MQRAAWIVGLSLVLLARAHAQQPLPLELDWQAPPECGSADDVRAELERIARVRPGFGLAKLAAQARVERQGSGYAVRLTTQHEGQAGERRLEAADCATLVRTLTLVLAIAFGKGVEVAQQAGTAEIGAAPQAEPDAPPAAQPAARAPEREGGVANAAPSASQPRPAARTEPAEGPQADSERAPLHVSLLLGAGVQLALLPDPAFTGLAGAELRSGPWSVGLRASAWPAAAARVGPGLQARFDGVAGALQGCGQLPLATLELGLCAAASAAALRGRSDGAFEDGSATAPWYALALGAALSWPAASAIRLRIEPALALSLARPRFSVKGFGEVHRVPLLAPQLGALLVVTP